MRTRFFIERCSHSPSVGWTVYDSKLEKTVAVVATQELAQAEADRLNAKFGPFIWTRQER